MKIKTKIGILGLVFAFLANPVFADLPSGSHVGPSANFTANPTAVLTLNPVSFDASTSRDSRGSQNLQYRWDFEGNYDWTQWKSSSKKTSHTFKKEGNFTSRLQVKDSDGFIDETALTIRVQTKRVDHAPTAKISVSQKEGTTSTNFQFEVEVFSKIHTPSHLLQVRWDWDHDGKWDTSFSRARDFFHTFENEGWQEVWLEVRDTDSSSSIEKGFYIDGKENDSMRNKEIGRIFVEKSTAPLASFRTWPVSISPNTNVHFNAAESIRASEYRWDFDGDGRFDVAWNSGNKKIQRVYSSVGIFDVILEVRNSAGEIDRTVRSVAVNDFNNILPEAKFTARNRTNSFLGSQTAVLLDEVQFSASGSRDEDGSDRLIEVRWDFEGDGIFDTTFSTEKTAVHRYTETGWQTPTLQIHDERGGMASDKAQIKVVANTAPIASLKITPSIGTRETSFRFDASAGRDDQTGTNNLDYRFDFNGDGIFDTKFTNGRSKSKKIPQIGKFTAIVEMRDHANATSRATASFEVSDPMPPSAAFVVEPRVGTFNTNFQFDASLTRDDSKVGGQLRYRWDFNYRGKNDVSYDTGWTSSPKYNHRFAKTGDHKVRLTVKNSVKQESDFFTKIKVHEASEHFAFLRKKGIISDESNPDQLITRAEIAKIIVKATKIRATRPRNQQFTDVKTKEWYAPFVSAVSVRGWISPKTNFAWRPDGNINRAEAAKIIISALFPRVVKTQGNFLKDVLSNAWYTRFVETAVREDLLEVENSEFKPAQLVTRAEVVEMISKLLQKYSTELRFSNFFKTNGVNFYADVLGSFDASFFDLFKKSLR